MPTEITALSSFVLFAGFLGAFASANWSAATDSSKVPHFAPLNAGYHPTTKNSLVSGLAIFCACSRRFGKQEKKALPLFPRLPTSPANPDDAQNVRAAGMAETGLRGWGGRSTCHDQFLASLCQALRTPVVRFCQSLLTTSQFTIGRCSSVVWPEPFVDGDIDASDR
jgi:hypothetical protein